jgi:hypothetical protein
VPHALRVVGVTFLLVMAQGHLPAVFALPAGLGDIATGLAAPPGGSPAALGTPESLSLLPLAFVPTVAVPLSVALHIVSLRRLRTADRAEEDRAGDVL